ncbi:AAA family ATPase [Oceanobacillus locisalsi]|uniref:AAA family ATPase n=1 Tax=Oceanobacillus locisalsi TaxID=546107 RepID=A0ABW3NLM1_9BACI
MLKEEMNQQKVNLANTINADFKATDYQEKVDSKDYELVMKSSEQEARSLIKRYPALKYFSIPLTGYFGLHFLVKLLLVGMILLFPTVAFFFQSGPDGIKMFLSLIVCTLIGLTIYGLIIKSYTGMLKVLSRKNEVEQFRLAFIDIINTFCELHTSRLKNVISDWKYAFEANQINFTFSLNDSSKAWNKENIQEYLTAVFNRELTSFTYQKQNISFSVRFKEKRIRSKKNQELKMEDLDQKIKQEEFTLCDTLYDKARNMESQKQKSEQAEQQSVQETAATAAVKEIDASRLEAIESKMDEIIGLQPVKDKVNQLINNQKILQERIRAGQNAKYHSEHLLFTGNPGTGKTMMARYISEIFQALNVVSKGHLIEVTRKDLVGEYVGQTAKQTQDYIEKAIGGVLFIDEAYSLSRGGENDFGKEAIDVLVKAMDDYKDDFVVVLAGYTDEMHDFLQVNSGLQSRLSTVIEFPDYSSKELLEMAQKKLISDNFVVVDEARKKLHELIQSKMVSGRQDGGNGRLVDKIIQDIIQSQGNRLSEATKNEERMEGDLLTILPEDIMVERNTEDFDLEAELAQIIGNEEVKQFIRQLEAQVKVNKKRKEQNIETAIGSALHMVFQGNPGTGKTTCARIVARLLYSLGILKKGHLVEVDRSDLVGSYIGHTENQTKNMVSKAMGGVLFIDEAYALARSSGHDFGQEAIDVLLKAMEDHREDLVVIVAGYTEEMQTFIHANPGLDSRIPNRIKFIDYSIDEMFAMLQLMVQDNKFKLATDCESFVKELFAREQRSEQPGNGRYVRNVFERAVRNMSFRLREKEDPSYVELTTLEVADFQLDK